MQVITDIIEENHDLPRLAIALGTFDGVHRGHQLLVSILRRTAMKLGVCSSVFTFDKHPMQILRNKKTGYLISTQEEKIRYFDLLDIDYLVFGVFDEAVARMHPVDFVTKILVDKMHVVAIAVGEDYTFGHRGTGDVRLLEQLGVEYGFQVNVIKRYNHEHMTTSSTEIRKLLHAGLVEEAAFLLGHPYQLLCEVVATDPMKGVLLIKPLSGAENCLKIIPPDGGYLADIEYNEHRLSAFLKMASFGSASLIFRGMELLLGKNDAVIGDVVRINFQKRRRDSLYRQTFGENN